MYHRDWLKTQIMSYLKDSTVGAELDTWIDLSAKRVSDTIECWQMETSIAKLPGEAYITIPNSMRKLYIVEWLNNGKWNSLLSQPKHLADRFKGDGQPYVYYLQDRKIYPAPYIEGEYRALVQSEVIIPPADGEVDALTAYPYIFLGAALAEAYDWKQDEQMRQKHEQKWLNEAVDIRGQYQAQQTGDTPAQRAI